MTEETIEDNIRMECLVDDTLLSDKMDLNITETINFINSTESMDVDQENDININNVNNDKKNIENEDEIVINKMKTKKLTIVDGDSEDEITTTVNNEISNEDSNSCESFIKKTLRDLSDEKDDTTEVKKNKKRITILDSDDSDSENVSKENEENNTKQNDSEDISDKEKNENNQNNDSKKKSRIKLYDSDSEEDAEDKQLSETSQKDDIVFSSVHKSNLSALCDPESSEDEEINVRRHNFDELESNQPILNYKKNQNRDDKPKKMTGKDAMQQRKEIQSESQRMMREQNVSLPYHKARSYTLKEFLEKRAKLSNIIPKSKPTHFNMKMTPKELEEMAKKLEQREKELDEFYKSEESEEETDDVKNDEKEEAEKEETKADDKTNEDKNVVSTKEELKKTDTEEKESEKELNEIQAVENTDVVKIAEKSDEDKIIEMNDDDKITEEDKIDNIGDSLKPTEKPEEQPEKRNEDVDKETTNSNNDNDEKTEEIQPQPEKPKTNKILERLRKLNPSLLKSDFKPCISGDSKDIIILDEDIEKTRAINNLKKRFIAQSTIKPIRVQDESDIISVDSSILKHEAAKVLIDHDDDTRIVELKPGEKLKKLKHELELQMAKRRREVFEKQQKELEEKKKEEEIYEGEKEECGLDDEEEEEEMTESESSEDEDSDMEIIEKPRKKSEFVDDEADESERDDSDDSESEVEESNENNIKKEMKRIINTFTEDDSEDEIDKSQTSLNTTQSVHNEMFDNSDDEIPLYQKENLDKTPRRPLTESKSELNLTPTICLTGLKGMESTSKRTLYESPGISLSLPPEPSPLRLNPGVKTKLFESNDGEGGFSQLEGLCSGKFTDMVESIPKLTTQDEDLLGLCSGTFDIPEKTTESGVDNSGGLKFDVNIPGYSQNKENVDKELSEISKTINIELENNSNDSFLDKNKEAETFGMDFDNSQDMKLTFEDDDSILKETLNEIPENDKTEKKMKKSETIRKLVILSSDEETETPELEKKKKKKKRKRKGLEFSDDEDSDVESITNEEELDVNPEVNYDSEENEVEFDENEEIVEKSAKNFFEAEAELSESEWGSADEDERGLDVLEMEDGDAEQFNEIKLQKELGKIHMRQVLDQDSREVRLIQELLLEDGELHGAKRERKFRWKNADSMTWNDDQPKDEEDEENDEVENELEWRKQRHEREVFLEEQRQKALRSANEIELLTSDSQILKIGHELLKKSQEIKTDDTTTVVPPKVESFSFLNKRGFRGSFLARSENTLSRLAEMTKVTEKEFFMSSGPKNSRNFVFTSVSKTEEIIEEVEENDKKRKAAEGTPTVLKKMRISENSPIGPRSNKKSKKSLFKPS